MTCASATQIAWRDWGSQFRVAPQPNLASKQVMTVVMVEVLVVVVLVVVVVMLAPPHVIAYVPDKYLKLQLHFSYIMHSHLRSLTLTLRWWRRSRRQLQHGL